MLALLVALGVISLAAVVVAVRAWRQAQAAAVELEYLATHDVLTGLPNRLSFEDDVNARLRSGNPGGRARAGTLGAVLVVAVDRFDAINDTYGHEVGDQVLAATARQLAAALPEGHALYRHGGPRFAVAAPDLDRSEAALELGRSLQAATNVPYQIRHDRIRISTSVAVVLLSARHSDADDVVRDLDDTVAEADRLGPGQVLLHELSMRSSLANFDLDNRLRLALERDELLLVWLPVVRLRDASIAGVEALLRWVTPEQGTLAPAEFLDHLESTGLIVPVGDWVLQQAAQQSRRWREQFPGLDLVTTVNLSPQQINDPGFVDRVRAIVADAGADPGHVCLELTEGASPVEVDAAWHELYELQRAGFQVALDDFGTGFSTFDLVRRFRVDVLKIDRVFTTHLGRSPQDDAIVQQVIAMAHELDLVTIAEGVDTAEQADLLETYGCDLAQGFHWTRPVPTETMHSLLAGGRLRPGAAAPRIDWKAPAPD
ncbi:MAG: bifunctional diguanylate cyclase/phosphodiesterase [Acidimicrobiales bacterium]|nr:bifunctional diguanylate cyclase/phosphodiesterase [Acidimicrobiales bacterium]